MSDGRFAILDPAAGISGDMLLGALVAAGAPPEWLRASSRSTRLSRTSRVQISTVDRCGVRATKVDVYPPRRPPGASGDALPRRTRTPFGHDHGHAHEPHRHIGELIAIESNARRFRPGSENAPCVRSGCWAKPKGRVHGAAGGPGRAARGRRGGRAGGHRRSASRDSSSWASSRIYNRPVAVGSGWVRAAHGVIPVPAPATACCSRASRSGPNGPVMGEATTPTGAVLLRVLSCRPPAGPLARRVAQGPGGQAGRNPNGLPQRAPADPGRRPPLEAGEVVLLSTDLDDLSPEYLDPLREALFAAGALDVQMWATQMKKGRTGFRVEATVAPAEADRVSESAVPAQHDRGCSATERRARHACRGARAARSTTGDGMRRARQGVGCARRTAGEAGIRRCRGGGPPNGPPRARGGKGLATPGSPPGESRRCRPAGDPEQGVVTSESEDRVGRSPAPALRGAPRRPSSSGDQRSSRQGDAVQIHAPGLRAQVGPLQSQQRRHLPEDRHRDRGPREQSARARRAARRCCSRRSRAEQPGSESLPPGTISAGSTCSRATHRRRHGAGQGGEARPACAKDIELRPQRLGRAHATPATVSRKQKNLDSALVMYRQAGIYR